MLSEGVVDLIKSQKTACKYQNEVSRKTLQSLPAPFASPTIRVPETFRPCQLETVPDKAFAPSLRRPLLAAMSR